MLYPSQEFVNNFVDKFLYLKPILKEHIEDYDEILPHVFLGEIAKWCVANYKNSSQENVQQIFEYIEQTFKNGGEEIQELISVSFLENLSNQNEDERKILKYLGPELLSEFKKINKI
ncbi:MAG: hypothetical protein CVV44_11890 [Spirochaetae bacterium HGW-Spirochaetae-1]|jgi:hypothetical protein|nr:MAG: hypothetical protein CVV44_11890 [Spirochaetae bacterium HGW-Spirochaetae-1]